MPRKQTVSPACCCCCCCVYSVRCCTRLLRLLPLLMLMPLLMLRCTAVHVHSLQHTKAEERSANWFLWCVLCIVSVVLMMALTPLWGVMNGSAAAKEMRDALGHCVLCDRAFVLCLRSFVQAQTTCTRTTCPCPDTHTHTNTWPVRFRAHFRGITFAAVVGVGDVVVVHCRRALHPPSSFGKKKKTTISRMQAREHNGLVQEKKTTNATNLTL